MTVSQIPVTSTVRAGVIQTKDLSTFVCDNRKVYATEDQIKLIECLKKTTKGGYATIHGYKPTTGYVTSPSIDCNFISRFSTMNLYKRKLKALQDVKFNDLKITAPKLLSLDETEQHKLFLQCVGKMIDSMKASIDGNRGDSNRKAHDVFYANCGMGVKVHLCTQKKGKETRLVLTNDGGQTTIDVSKEEAEEMESKGWYPIINSVMLSIIEISRKIVIEGQKKPAPNSGPKVLMDNTINEAIKSKTVSMKTISLKSDNFDSLAIGGDLLDADKAGNIEKGVQ